MWCCIYTLSRLSFLVSLWLLRLGFWSCRNFQFCSSLGFCKFCISLIIIIINITVPAVITIIAIIIILLLVLLFFLKLFFSLCRFVVY